MGNPGVFQGYPDPGLVKTHTQPQGMGFTRYGYRYPSGHTDMSSVLQGLARLNSPGLGSAW